MPQYNCCHGVFGWEVGESIFGAPILTHSPLSAFAICIRTSLGRGKSLKVKKQKQPARMQHWLAYKETWFKQTNAYTANFATQTKNCFNSEDKPHNSVDSFSQCLILVGSSLALHSSTGASCSQTTHNDALRARLLKPQIKSTAIHLVSPEVFKKISIFYSLSESLHVF